MEEIQNLEKFDIIEPGNSVQSSENKNESKEEKKNDNKGIKLIKEFIKNMYYAYGKEFNKKDD